MKVLKTQKEADVVSAKFRQLVDFLNSMSESSQLLFIMVIVLFLDTVYGTTAPPILDTGQRRRLGFFSIFSFYSIYETEYKML